MIPIDNVQIEIIIEGMIMASPPQFILIKTYVLYKIHSTFQFFQIDYSLYAPEDKRWLAKYFEKISLISFT